MGFFASLNKRRWLTIGVTLFLAFLSGHLMQSGANDPVLRNGTMLDYNIEPTGSADAEATRSSVLPDEAPVPGLSNPPILPLRVDEAWLDRTLGCAPQLSASVAPAATIKIELLAPCSPGERLRLRHGPIVADVLTDANGQFETRIPALAEDALVSIEFRTVLLEARLDVPSYADFHHVVLQHDGDRIFELNAYEFGATDWQTGHVWPGSPKSPERALEGGGFLTSLGHDIGYGFEIYSVPVGLLPVSGVIRLTVDAAITQDTCDRDVRATAYQTGPLGRLSPSDIRVTLPDCARVGDVLRLQNVFPDMRLALR